MFLGGVWIVSEKSIDEWTYILFVRPTNRYTSLAFFHLTHVPHDCVLQFFFFLSSSTASSCRLLHSLHLVLVLLIYQTKSIELFPKKELTLPWWSVVSLFVEMNANNSSKHDWTLGESGLGKTTFINTLFATTIKNYKIPEKRHEKQLDRTVDIEITKAGK